MPLRLLKRTSKQYNVVSKTTFVISVDLLDNGTMECTLDADSTGKDCLLNISQRLGLHQPEFFGLRYISRGVPPRQRWVELERPLKRQLEKHAQDSQLSLGVMFYVADVNLLKDEMARYHYFLQLKSDVIDGKLNCNLDQAISLAAYSLQAEFGDYDPERHTIEYLRDFAILPKELSSEEKFSDVNLDALHEAVARQYGSLVGFPPPLAEIYYIMVAQQLDGYGQEAYPAKDDAGNDILICVSLNGLVIRRRDWTHVAVFRWSDIKSLIGHKRLFVVEKAISQRTMQFHFTDPEVAKYVRKMCILQSNFFKQHLQSDSEHRNQNLNTNSTDVTDAPSHLGLRMNMRATPDLIAPSLMARNTGSQYSLNNNCFGAQGTSSSSSLSMQLLQSQHRGASSAASSAQPQLSQQGIPTTSQQQFHRSLQELPQLRSFTPMPTTSTSDGLYPSHVNLTPSINDLHTLQSLLPSYRHTPDYETAVQMQHSVGTSQYPFEGQSTSNSEDEPIYQNEIVSQIHSIELRDSMPKTQAASSTTSVTAPRMESVSPAEAPAAQKVSSQSTAQPQTEDPHAYMYKPPPPYPGPKMDNPASSSSSAAAVNTANISTGSESCVTKITIGESVNVQAGPVLVTSTSSQLQVGSSIPENVRATAQPQVSPSSSFAGGNNSGRSSRTSMENKSVEPSTSSNSMNVSSASSLDVSKSSEKSEKSSKRNSTSGSPHKSTPKHGASSSSSSEKNKDRKLYGKPIEPNILKEYHTILQTKPNASFALAMKRENARRNRCPSILPYEDSCIRLSPTRNNTTGYINASPVSATLNGRDWKYIVGQIPLAGNAPAIWQLIWETEAKIIAVLERDSTAPFYPPDSSIPLTFDSYQIVENKERSNCATIAREFILTFLPKKKQRKVWVLPYEEEWKDDVPIHTEHFLCFLEEVNSIQRKVSDPNTPLVVLCGTGAGRGGVLILSDLLLHAADSGHKLRCDNLLGELRNQRMMLVSSASQYAFVLHTLAKYLAQSRLI